MSQASTVVVVGGGYGGVNVARALDADTNIVLVEPKDAFVHNEGALRALVEPTFLRRHCSGRGFGALAPQRELDAHGRRRHCRGYTRSGRTGASDATGADIGDDPLPALAVHQPKVALLTCARFGRDSKVRPSRIRLSDADVGDVDLVGDRVEARNGAG